MGESATITIATDTTGTEKAVNDFVDSFNELMTYELSGFTITLQLSLGLKERTIIPEFFSFSPQHLGDL